MAEWTERAELLFEKEGLEKLQNAKVLFTLPVLQEFVGIKH